MVEANTQQILTVTEHARKSERVKKQPKRFGFLHETGQSDIDPKTYEDAISDIDLGHWLKAMKSEMDSMHSNKVWTLVDPQKGIVLVGRKWIYKQKLRANEEMTTYKAS